MSHSFTSQDIKVSSLALFCHWAGAFLEMCASLCRYLNSRCKQPTVAVHIQAASRSFRCDVQGMMALGCMRPIALAVHAVLGAMVAAALAANNSSTFADLELRYSYQPQIFWTTLTFACKTLIKLRQAGSKCHKQSFSRASFRPSGPHPKMQYAVNTVSCVLFERKWLPA